MAARDIIVISAVLFVTAIVLFIFFYAGSTIATKMIISPAINQSASAVTALNGINNTINRFDYVFFMVFIGLTLSIIITGFMVGGNPVFTFIYVIVLTLTVVFSAVLSNVWESASTTAVLGTTLTSFPITDFVMLKLPFFMAAIGFLGLVVMFAKPALTGGEGF